MSWRNRFSCLALLALLLSCLSPLLAQQSREDQQAPQLSEKERRQREKALRKELETPYKKWLDEDVAYIIAPEEREAFKHLNTDEEREQFIEQFWLRRDPTPDTVENEFREEHYRRIAYTNERFSSGKPGWRTDRGRIYIMWGPPDEIESHPSGGSYMRPPEEGGGTTSTFPFEKWRYRYLEGVGQEVILEFVDPTMSGEYRLTMDPSEKDALLNVPNAGLTTLEEMGLASKTERFNRTDGTRLGRAIGGEPASMNQFERLQRFAAVQRPPQVKFKDLEALVTTKISYNLLPFELRADFVRVTNDTILVPITIQIANKNISFQTRDEVHRAVVNVFGRISTLTGRIAQTFEDVISLDLPDSLFQMYLTRNSIYQKIVPLRPGLYRMDLVLKDVNSGNLGTLQQRLTVPRFDDEQLSASSLILADLLEKVPSRQIGTGPFVIGNTKVRPAVGERFRRDQRLGIYIQVYNLAVDEKSHKPQALVEYAVLRDKKPIFQASEDASQIPHASQQITLEKMLPLESLEPGRYELEIKVTDQLANRTITPKASFTITK